MPVRCKSDTAFSGSAEFVDWSYPWWGAWFDHQNRRDDRAEAFAAEDNLACHQIPHNQEIRAEAHIANHFELKQKALGH